MVISRKNVFNATTTATGQKVLKTVQTNTGITRTRYDHEFIYKNGALQFISQPEGYIEPDDNGGFTYVYQYKDQVGNIRLSYKNTGSATNPVLTIIQENNYYPFGMQHKGYNEQVNGKEYPYKTFQGQELNKELNLNWISFKYRNYDPAIGRFMSVDPLAEEFSGWSPYNFTMNNPINMIDPDGRAAMPPDEFDKDGNKISKLGGDKIDFYHQANGDTKIVDRASGASNIITGGESLIRGYTHRDKNTSWGTLFNEFDQGVGPENSLLSDFKNSTVGIFGSLNKKTSIYGSKARKNILSKNNNKGQVPFNYWEINPITAGTDGWEQFLGKTNLSYYKLGDKVLFLMTDSKSNQSLLYHINGVKNWDRTKSHNHPGSTTYQTYIWTESFQEIKNKSQ